MAHRASGHLSHLVCGVQRTGVVTAFKFFNVTMEMFGAELVVYPLVSPFQHGPMGWNPIGVRLTVDVFLRAMGHGLMVAVHTLIGGGFIGVDRGKRFCVVIDKTL